MIKKGLSLLLAAMVVAMVFAMSGCINSAAQPVNLGSGITLSPYSDGEKYGAEIYILSYDIYESEVVEAQEVFLEELKKEFKTTSIEGYPMTPQSNSEGFYVLFGYDIEITEKDWFFYGEPEPKVDPGFFMATVNIDYPNPFAKCLQEGTRYNKVLNNIRQRCWQEGILNNIDLYDFDATVLMGGRYTMKTETGGVMFETQMNYHYYYLSESIANVGSSRMVYSYTAPQSYAWFILALVLGLLTVGIILLAAKKKNGSVVDVKIKKMVQPSVEYIFDPFNLDGDGSGGTGITVVTGDGSGTDGTGGTGDVFDGF